MKAVERAKLVRSLRQESRRLRLLVLVIGFFLVTLTFVVVSKPDALLFNRTYARHFISLPSSLPLDYILSPGKWERIIVGRSVTKARFLRAQ